SGSIYLQIADIPTSVDSIFMQFESDEGNVWAKMFPRSPKLYASLDNIPHNTQGMLYIAALDEAGDTVCCAQAEIEVNAHNMSSGVVLDFSEGPGGFALSGSLIIPGANVVIASMGDVQAATVESGELIVTEIMYAANDSEYIELYNPSEEVRTFSTLIIDVDGTSRTYNDVSVDGYGYLVIGRCALPWVDRVVPGTTGMDLSGNGNWITVSDASGTILDQVVFTGGKNDLDWPRLSGKRSVFLKSDVRDPVDNNFGRNWAGSETLIDGSESQYGSPRS
ncbi:MAG: lamin tail domain-containing protein, partial [Candidatus Pacearchaeota archaeon]|nr:lamin tail domain-containing protein [Candidatus Pacearchaeota archaeon]